MCGDVICVVYVVHTLCNHYTVVLIYVIYYYIWLNQTSLVTVIMTVFLLASELHWQVGTIRQQSSNQNSIKIY